MPRPLAHVEPLGLPTLLRADDAALLERVLPAFGGRRSAPDAGATVLRLDIRRGGGEAAGPVTHRVDGGRLLLGGGDATGEADVRRGAARCAVGPALAADPERLVAEVLDPLLLFLLTRAGRIPVHAAGVMAGDVAAVLAGPSGVGKSTLAHAAARAGLPVVSDDTVYVQLRPRVAVHGLPRPIHLLDAGGGEGRHRLRAGRWKRAVDAGPAPAPAGRAALFLLERGDRAALHPLAPEEAVARMSARIETGFDHFREALPEAVRGITAGGAWRLVLSRDPCEAITLLRSALDRARV